MCNNLIALHFQSLLKNAGVKGLKTVFIITDAQIKEESFLEDIDSVLNTGEVPNLFAADEKQEIMEVSLEILFNVTCLLSYFYQFSLPINYLDMLLVVTESDSSYRHKRSCFETAISLGECYCIIFSCMEVIEHLIPVFHVCWKELR